MSLVFMLWYTNAEMMPNLFFHDGCNIRKTANDFATIWKYKRCTPVRLKDVIISIKRSCDKRRGLEWAYSLFSAYASALKSNRRMALLAGSLAHMLIFYPHTDMYHTCSAFLNTEGKASEASSIPSNDYLTWVSGTLHRHYHRLEGWIKGRKKINVKHSLNETWAREKLLNIRTL